MKNKNDVELLAPAGSFESLVVAIQNGADAAYIGGSKFGARAFAGNFDNEEIVRAIEYAHIRDVKIFVTINTLIRDDEIQECLEFIKFLYENDVDAIILQDIGLASIIRDLFPDLELHASTQMSITNLQEVKYYEQLGFKRIVLARENNIDEIRNIRNNTNVDIECFVHGALCVSYSGKCLYSYFNGGRSSNRGACAQPCRKMYDHINNANVKTNNYFLSTKDLCTIDNVESLINNGVYSFKIEGRMKKPEYVATVVKSYREAIDAVVNKKSYDLASAENNLKLAFNREFTKGLILNDMAKNIGNNKSAKNIGIPLGNIISKGKNFVEIRLENDIKKGDGTSLGENIGRIIKNNQVVDTAKSGDVIKLDYIGKSSVGDEVRKTSSVDITDLTQRSLREEQKKIYIDASVDVKIGEFAKIRVFDSEREIEYEEKTERVSIANNASLTDEIIQTQLSKTNDTAFIFKNIECNIEEGAFLKKSTINSLRRNSIKKFEDLKKKTYIDRSKKDIKFEKNLDYNISNSKKFKISADMLRVKCFTKEQIQCCKDLNVGYVYVDSIVNFGFAKDLELDIKFCVPTVLKDSQIEEIDKFIAEEKPSIMTNSIGYAKNLANKFELTDISIDYFANVYNDYTIDFLTKEHLFESICPSLENQFLIDKELILNKDNIIEFPLYIHPILMFTEFCPYKKDVECKRCLIDNSNLISQDNKSKTIIKRDMFCRMQVIDKNPIKFDDRIEFAIKNDIKKYRIDLLEESYEETKKIIKKYIS